MNKTAEDLVSEIKTHLGVIRELEKVNSPINPTTSSIEHLIELIKINLSLLKRNYPKEYRSLPKSLIQFARTNSAAETPLFDELYGANLKEAFKNKEFLNESDIGLVHAKTFKQYTDSTKESDESNLFDILKDLLIRLWEGPIKGFIYILIIVFIFGLILSLLGLA